jgi:hypothetical protein
MTETNPSDAATTPKPRWYVPTPAKFLFAVLVMQGILFLSARYHWFWFNERKGYTVLIAVAATAVALPLLVAAVMVSRFSKSKTQFSLATLLLMVPVMGIPCAWLAREMELARQQRLAVEAIGSRNGQVPYIQIGPPPMVYQTLAPLFGIEFFMDVHGARDPGASDADLEQLTRLSQLHRLELWGSEVTDAGVVQVAQLKQLRTLDLCGAEITDAGIDHLRRLRHLRQLRLFNTRVTAEGRKSLQESLPECNVQRFESWTDPIGASNKSLMIDIEAASGDAHQGR